MTIRLLSAMPVLLLATSVYAQTPAAITRAYWACIGQYAGDCEAKTKRFLKEAKKIPEEQLNEMWDKDNWLDCEWYRKFRGRNAEHTLGLEICSRHSVTLRSAIRVRTQVGNHCGYGIFEVLCRSGK